MDIIDEIMNKLAYLQETENQISLAIQEKEVDVPAGSTFKDLAVLISSMEAGGNLEANKTVEINANGTHTIVPTKSDVPYDGMTKVTIKTSKINTGATACSLVCKNGADNEDAKSSGTFSLPANKTGYVLTFSTTQNSSTHSCSTGTKRQDYNNGGTYGSSTIVVAEATIYTITATSSARTITVKMEGNAMRHSCGIACY